MTLNQLKEVMKYHLRHLNTQPDIRITDNTIHKDVLADDDGPPTSKDLYRSLVQWSLSVTGDKDPSWPKGWMDQSVKDLAPKLLK